MLAQSSAVPLKFTVSSAMQPLNAQLPIEVTALEKLMLVRELQPAKVLSPIEVTPSGRVILVRDVQ